MVQAPPILATRSGRSVSGPKRMREEVDAEVSGQMAAGTSLQIVEGRVSDLGRRNPQGTLHQPVVSGQAPLGSHGSLDRPHRADEGDEERIACGTDLYPAAALDGLPQDLRIDVPDRRIPVAQALQQPGGALDVTEQKVTVPVGNALVGERAGGTDPGQGPGSWR